MYNEATLKAMMNSLSPEQQAELGLGNNSYENNLYGKIIDKENDTTIANKIKEQLLSLDENALMCWGAKNFISTKTNSSYEGGLIFDISNVKDIGTRTIKITLDLDTYIIEIFNQDKIIHTFKNVYAFDLTTTIGDVIGY
jgi:hypothetical protein